MYKFGIIKKVGYVTVFFVSTGIENSRYFNY